MPMNANDIETLIKAGIPDAKVTIRDLAGDGDHYAATVLAESFRGKSRVQQHQLVYNVLKGKPQFPMCGFSAQVVQILDHLGVPYKGLNVLENEELRNGIKSYSNWPTIPQLYVKGEFVGGCDIVREMFQAGELQSLMKEKGVPVKAGAPA